MKAQHVLFAFLLFFLCLKLPKHYARWSGGFHPASCTTSLMSRPEWEPQPPSTEVQKILSQPFFLQRRGSQAYAFFSQDGQYVLKIFAQPLKKYLFPHKFRAPPPRQIYQQQIEEGIEGYRLASTLPPQRTALLYVHLNTTKDLLASVTLRDAWLRTYQLPLDNYRFVLQRRCSLLAPILKQANPQERERLSQSYLKAIAERASHRLRNNDTEFKKNFGVLNGEVIEFDCGAYSYDPKLASPREQEAEVERFAAQLHYWLIPK